MQGYNNIDQRIHLLSQTIAKINRTFVPAKPDDSHTNLSCDSIQGRIFGRWIEVHKKRYIFCLNLSEQSYQWLSDHMQVIHSFPFAGHTTVQTESKIARHLPELGLDPDGFQDPLHFEITDYPFAKEAFETLDVKAVHAWLRQRRWANYACADVLRRLQVSGEIRIWPHHFDTGIYVPATPVLGIGFGLAIQDKMVGSPYYYIAGYAKEDTHLKYDQLPRLKHGEWIIREHWKGAVLRIEDAWKDGKMNLLALSEFVDTTLNWYLDPKKNS